MNSAPDRQSGRAASRLVLGTVQFGMSYGVTNRSGQVSLEQARGILACAAGAGIDLVDTAPAYGMSEKFLGQCLTEFPGIGVVTKTAAIQDAKVGPAEIRRVRETVARSMDLLQRPRLDGLLVHQCGDLFKPGGEAISELLMSLKAEGVVGRIGVSIYNSKDIDGVLRIFSPDIVQLPVNLFDQRLIRSGHIAALRSAGIEIHARSAFLQGILLADLSTLPGHFQSFGSDFARYRKFLEMNELSPLSACLGFMLQQGGVDRVIVGVAAKSELEQILASVPKQNLPAMDSLASESVDLIDPRMWPATRDAAEVAKQ